MDWVICNILRAGICNTLSGGICNVAGRSCKSRPELDGRRADGLR